MKLPSLQHLFDRIWIAFRRFFVPILFAVVGTIAAIALIETEHAQNPSVIRLFLTCVLGLPFSVGCMLFAERSTRAIKLAAINAAVLLPALYGLFIAPGDFFENEMAALLFIVLLVVAHLFVSVAAYLRVKEYDGFWRFNQLLFLRMFESVVFSGVLFLGLALAIASVDHLFEVTIAGRRYPQLWCMVAGIFNTWFFLAGVPRDYKDVNTRRDFPKGLKLFSQYILLPLATLYLIILYAYGFKILSLWSLPRGWVSMLIMCYAVIGLLAILLVYPLKDDKEHTWIRLFIRIFFIALLPLIVLLYAAIIARTRQYGITEPRYYLIVLGLWLAFISFYFIFSPKKNIKLIPISLMITGLLTIIGPWSSFSVSTRSQVGQMKKVLNKYHIRSAANGMTPPKQALAKEDAMQLYSIVQYFIEKRELHALDNIYGRNVAQIAASIEKKNRAIAQKNKQEYYRFVSVDQTRDTLLAMLHVKMDRTDIVRTREGMMHYESANKGFVNIAGYDELYEYRYNSYEDDIEEQTLTVQTGKDSLKLVMKNDKAPALLITEHSRTVARFELGPVIDSFKKNQKAVFQLKASGERKAGMIVNFFELNTDSSKRPIEHWQAYILLGK